ncbi:MAG: OsmC family protein [Acidobacteriota bacterium]
MVGTFGGALEARQINASNKNLTAEVTGEIEKEDNVLVIKRIHVVYQLNASENMRETVERVHEMHAEYCPVYRSLYKAIDITTEYRLNQN